MGGGGGGVEGEWKGAVPTEFSMCFKVILTDYLDNLMIGGRKRMHSKGIIAPLGP